MTNITTQKVIKIGDSAGITFPAKQLKQAGIKPGDNVRVSYELIEEPQEDVLSEYAEFKAQYGDTLKNLADR